MIFDEVSRKGRSLKNKRFNFEDTRSLLVKKELYTFAYGAPVTAYKYVNFSSTEQPIKTDLSTLPRNEYLQSFSVALTNKSKSIVLTGGCEQDDGTVSAKTFVMQVAVGKWQK